MRLTRHSLVLKFTARIDTLILPQKKLTSELWMNCIRTFFLCMIVRIRVFVCYANGREVIVSLVWVVKKVIPGIPPLHRW